MGARPIAVMNSLSFGDVNHYKTNQLVNGVVSGIGGYGNCFGVPTVGGETRFDLLIMEIVSQCICCRLVDKDKIFYSAASGSVCQLSTLEQKLDATEWAAQRWQVLNLRYN